MPRWLDAESFAAVMCRARIAYLEHELLDPPYQHATTCMICHPDWSWDTALRDVNSTAIKGNEKKA